MNRNMLVGHRDIQEWVNAHRGQPALARVPDRSGNLRSRLAIKFRSQINEVGNASLDDGMSPCSWTQWLAELDRQNLALRVADRAKGEGFEFVDRGTLN